MWMLTGDPVRDAESYDRYQIEQAEKRPKCAICGEPIWEDKALHLWGEWFCDECIENAKISI